MNTEKLNEIIQTKNERLERQAVQTAEEHIEAILRLNDCIAKAQAEIKEHQEELKKLEIQSVSLSSILGG